MNKLISSKSHQVPYRCGDGVPCVLEITESVYETSPGKAIITIEAQFHSIKSTWHHDWDRTRGSSELVETVISQNRLRAKAIKALLDEMKVMYDALRLIFEGE